MHAHARLDVEVDPGGSPPARTRIAGLRSDPPLLLRPTYSGHDEPMRHWDLGGGARVHLAAGAAGPLGGDRLRLDVQVGAGAALVLRSVAASLLLPGPHGNASHSEVTIRVGAGATLLWLPRPVIAARGCSHDAVTRIALEPGARLLAREELVFGRHGEQPGTVRQRLRVTVANDPVHDQELSIGLPAAGWEGPAVTGGRRATGSLLVVDPGWDTAELDLAPVSDVDSATLPLTSAAVLVTALADDALTLRRRLDERLAALELQALESQALESQAAARALTTASDPPRPWRPQPRPAAGSRERAASGTGTR